MLLLLFKSTLCHLWLLIIRGQVVLASHLPIYNVMIVACQLAFLIHVGSISLTGVEIAHRIHFIALILLTQAR